MSDERVEMTRAAYDLPPNMQFTTVKEGTMKMLLHIDSNGVMTIGAGLSADEATQAAAKMLVDEFAKAHNTEIASLRAELSRLSALVACRGDEINRMADAIDAARYAHPLHPRERPVPFAEADRTDREYAFRLARAAFAAITAPPVSQLKDTTNADK